MVGGIKTRYGKKNADQGQIKDKEGEERTKGLIPKGQQRRTERQPKGDAASGRRPTESCKGRTANGKSKVQRQARDPGVFPCCEHATLKRES